MRTIQTLQVSGSNTQTALDELNALFDKMGLAEKDVISVQRIPLLSPVDMGGPSPDHVVLWAFYWGK